MRQILIAGLVFLLLAPVTKSVLAGEAAYEPSFASQWLDIMQDVAANEIQRVGARPTIISLQMGMIVNGMYDASSGVEMAALSRMLGGYHIRTDNEVGLTTDRKIADYLWPILNSYFDGTYKK